MFRVYENLGDCVECEYLQDISLYESAPRCEKHIHEIQDICLERTKLYKILIEATSKNFKKYEKEWIEFIVENIENDKSLEHFFNLLNKKNQPLEVKKQSREFDYIGHCVMSLVYSSKECSDSKMFLRCEIDWLFLRTIFMNVNDLCNFLNCKNLNYRVLSCDEKYNLKEYLMSSYNLECSKYDCTNFYKVNFKDIVNLLRERTIFLKDGMGFIPENYLVYFLVCIAKNLWKEKLVRCAQFIRNYNNPQTDTLLRNIPILRQSNTVSSSGTNNISLENIEEHAAYFYPLCMQNIHYDLKRNHHLKHNARMQYSLFLKHTGMPYEEAMEFWELEFTKKISAHEFKTRKFKYWFQHRYGKVGGKYDYPPDHCDKIIRNRPMPYQNHGCPFAHFDEENLKKTLKNKYLSTLQIEEVIEIKRKGFFKEACRKFCEFSNSRPTETFNRPDEYYHNLKDIEDLFTD